MSRLWGTSEWISLDEACNLVPYPDRAVSIAVATGEPVRDAIVWWRSKSHDWVRLRLDAIPFGWTDEVVVTFTDVTLSTGAGAPRPGET